MSDPLVPERGAMTKYLAVGSADAPAGRAHDRSRWPTVMRVLGALPDPAAQGLAGGG